MDRWKEFNSVENRIKKEHDNISKQIQDDIQDIFNEIDLSDLSYINKAQKEKLIRFVDKYKDKGIYSPYIVFLIDNILLKRNITQKDILELKLLLIFDNQYKQFHEVNEVAFKEIIDIGYRQCMIDIKKNVKSIPITELLILFLASLNGQYDYKEYMQDKVFFSAEQIIIQAELNNIQEKELDINNYEFQKILDKQNREILNINGEKTSGFIEIVGNSLYNKAYTQAGDDNNIQRYLFISVMDGRETDVCRSMNMQIFYTNKMNEYYRYNEETQNIALTKTFGLIPGINKPPITTTFHPCRSYIIALINDVEQNLEIPEIYEGFKEIAQNASNNKYISKLFDKYLTKDNSIIDYNNDKVMYYNRDKDKIVINPSHNDFNKYDLSEALTHEVVHLIDIRKNIVVKNEDLISSKIRQSELYINANSDKYNKLFENNKYADNMLLSDIFSAITLNKVYGNLGHSNKYWYNHLNREYEVFSNLLTLDIIKDIDMLKIINDIEPLKYLKERFIKDII